MSRIASSPISRLFSRRAHRFLGLGFVALFVLIIGRGVQSANAEEQAVAAKDPVVAQIDEFILEHPVDKSNKRWRTKLKKPPILKFDPKKTYTWKLDTNVGVISFRLFDDIAPMHVSSTLYLTRLGFYDTLKFHRVISGFMAQGGDPLGNGRGGPGYKFSGEFDPKAVHDSAGLLSMANSGPGTDGSQFFITFRDTPALNNRHTIYGKAESKESIKTLEAMEALGRPRDPAPPLKPLFIKTATIVIE
jgi:cyclophilin family peptidyl-prolyl cis-trans isomerase